MAAKKRTEDQINKDREFISERYCRGFTFDQITMQLNEMRPYALSMQQVHQDMQVARERWRTSYIDDWKTKVVAELARLDAVWMEAWQAWRRSCLDAEKTKAKFALKPGKLKKGIKKRPMVKVGEEQERTGQYGDPRFMDIMLKVTDQRCRVLGLFVTKIASTDPSGQKPVGLSEQDARDILKTVFVDTLKLTYDPSISSEPIQDAAKYNIIPADAQEETDEEWPEDSDNNQAG